MPLPMVHLGIARKIASTNINLINSPLYYLGSIAPDAIHSRVGSSKIDKTKTHIRNDDSTWYDDVIRFTLNHRNSEGKIEPFFIGYTVHILTDMLWEGSIHTSIRIMMDQDNIEKCNQSSVYYNETDQLDFELFKYYPWKNEVWCLLENVNALNVDELLTCEEIDKWKVRILHWYDSWISKYNDPIKYLNLHIIDNFINNAAIKIVGMTKDLSI